MIKIKFTKEELYIIERTMDMLSTEHLKGVGQLMNTFERQKGKIKEKGIKFIEKEFDDWVKTFDTLKTISAKCEMLSRGKRQ